MFGGGETKKNNQLIVAFDRSAVSPLNTTVPADAVAGTPARQVLGGPIFAGTHGANDYVGNPPAIKLSPRGGFAYGLNPQTVVRGGYGLFWAPWVSGVSRSSIRTAMRRLSTSTRSTCSASSPAT